MAGVDRESVIDLNSLTIIYFATVYFTLSYTPVISHISQLTIAQ